ncbi:hypothetical protein V495_00005 [Pseudogymnoascus sp. VKM F-4514 (FW-929)]|nr:hypothetical protein V495_00005 [Pseudogymnoascus sp. VKM F-4514 (FW-929)]KFY55018.1 hypothetical protein V497_07257 [Pseudogymnoascus sp. VKM F-4516 (FW-969)]
MACPIPLRVNLRRLPSGLQNFREPIRRTFLTLPGSELITLKETRILPYESSSIYTLIADVDRYSSFIPYCQESRVTRWSEPDTKGKRWPEQADLKVGWGGLEETFTSKLNCVPDTIVEALGGDAVPAVSKQQSLGRLSRESPAIPNNIFKRLSTRWTVKPLPGRSAPNGRDLTEVNLAIEFQFSNPLYGSLSKAVAPKLAEVMIEAFEKRAKLLLDSPR